MNNYIKYIQIKINPINIKWLIKHLILSELQAKSKTSNPVCVLNSSPTSSLSIFLGAGKQKFFTCVVPFLKLIKQHISKSSLQSSRLWGSLYPLFPQPFTVLPSGNWEFIYTKK